MTEPYVQVNIKILEKEYQISCPTSERAALMDSAELLNGKMRERVEGALQTSRQLEL